MACTDDEEVIEIFSLIKKWHESRIRQVKEILATPADTTIILRNKGEQDGVPLSAVEAAAYRAGVALALELFGNFPLKIFEASQTQEEDED